MKPQSFPPFFGINKTFFCVTFVLFFMISDLVSSTKLDVDPIDDTRTTLMSYSSGSSKSGGSSSTKSGTPSNTFLRTVDEIEKSLYDAQAMRIYYSQSSLRLKKIKDNIKLASKNSNSRFLKQSLGHALYTTIEMEMRKKGRKKRSSSYSPEVKNYMDKIKDEIGKDTFDKMMGVNESVTLMFVIDTTGSMSDEIKAVKDIAEYIIDHQANNTVVDYILSPFNDPNTGPVQHMKVGQGKEFIQAIGDLSAWLGYDCPEKTFTGISDALNEGAQQGSPLYVFTDATAKDATLEKTVINVAKSKEASVYFFTTGLCNKKSYKPFENLAKATSGKMFELPKNGFDLTTMKKITNILSQPDNVNAGEDYYLGRGMGRRSINSFVHKLPFDDSMEKIIVLVTTENKGTRIDLKDPLGSIVSTGKTPLPKGATFEVNQPRPGNWKLIVSPRAGKYSYLIKGSGKTNVAFDFIFVILRKRMSPLPISHPLIGRSAYAVLIIRGTDKINRTSLNLEIASKDGTVLGTTSVHLIGKSGAHFWARFPTPTVPFKLKLTGKTKKNYDFERNSANIVHPSHAVVRVLYATDEFTVSLRTRGTVVFFVYNTGLTEIFDFKVKDSSTFNVSVFRPAVRVYTNRSGFFYAQFRAKPTATPGDTDSVLVTATGRTSKVSVSHMFSLMVRV